nr:hypothetical protein [Bradyrhizobium liaoningense]
MLKASAFSHCTAWPAPSITCTAPRHSVGGRQALEVAEIDDLLFRAVDDRERDFQVAYDLDLVDEAAGLRIDAEIAARIAVGPAKILFDKGRDRRIAGREGRQHPFPDLRLARIRREDGRRQSLESGKTLRPGADRRRAKDHQAGGTRQ